MHVPKAGLVASTFLAIALALPSETRADEPFAFAATRAVLPPLPAPSDVVVLDAYRRESLYLRFSFWRGYRVYRDGHDADLGFFGRRGDEVFAGSPAALDSITGFRSKRISGLLMNIVGVGLIVADIVLLTTESELVTEPRPGRDERKPLFWYLLVPGEVMIVAGGFTIASASVDLSDAIDSYNLDLANRLRRPSLASSPRRPLGLRWRRRF